ncbi:helix-turn-helix domain-containing protein (plasmid) [Paracoccus marcusii]|uniref:helix-turn-helix domain-containing protein n=1 Tax=Paracoccus marcusii TaxID=59779 RepID=UPI0038B7175D
MEALYPEPVSISDICDRLDCSARSLQPAFLEYGLPSPQDVLTHIRLDRARSYRMEGTMNATQAATEAGLVHMSRFSGLYMRAFSEYPIRTLGSRRSEY